MTRTMPTQTLNHNVPKDVLLIAESELSSGEIIVTYYIDLEGRMLGVCDWVSDKPYPVGMYKLCRLTGMTEGMIRGIYESWRRNVLGIIADWEG